MANNEATTNWGLSHSGDATGGRRRIEICAGANFTDYPHGAVIPLDKNEKQLMLGKNVGQSGL